MKKTPYPGVAWWLTLGMVAGLLAPLVAQGQSEQEKVTFDRWYVLMLGESRAGYARITQMERGEQIISQTQMHFAFKRGPVAMAMEQSISFTESVDGRAIEAMTMMKPGAAAITQTMRFGDSGIELSSGQGEQPHVQRLPALPADALPPAAMGRYVQRQLAAGANEIDVRMIDISMGPAAVDVHIDVVGEENVEVFGKVVPAVAWDMTLSNLPGMVMREYVDGQAQTVKATIPLFPGMEFTMLQADEALARMEVDPPELMASTLVEPVGRIDEPRELRSAVYEVRVKSSEDGGKTGKVDLPRSGYQRVVWGDEETAAVIVDLDQPVNPVHDLPTAAHLSSSTMLNHEDPKIGELVAEALGARAESMSDAEKGRRLRAYVAEYIEEKDLSVGLATASEIARTRQGDCSEHAVLLAAMLRACGIPSRTVSGLIYVDDFLGQQNVFGYHMWAQAWVGGDAGAAGARWIDLDATLMRDFDAAHISLAISSLEDAKMNNDMVALLPLMGRLEVKVVQTGGQEAEAIDRGAAEGALLTR